MAAADTNTSAIRNCETTKIITAVYSVQFAGNSIKTTVTADPSAVDYWIQKFPVSFCRFFSMDISVCSLTSEVLTLHLCCDYNKCLIIHLDKLSNVPKSLKSFCSDQSYKFAGVDIGDKVRRIKEDYNYDLEFTNQIEIADGDIDIKGKEFFRREKVGSGMLSLVTDLMDVYFVKKKKLMQVDGMKTELDRNQVEEATVDAHVAYRIGFIIYYG